MCYVLPLLGFEHVLTISFSELMTNTPQHNFIIWNKDKNDYNTMVMIIVMND